MKLPNTMKCSQCDLPAIAVIAGQPLCVDHYTKMASALEAQNDQLARTMNYLYDMMERATGIPGIAPKIETRQPIHARIDASVNQITIDRSVVGAVNQGTVDGIEVALNYIRQGQDENVAEAIKELTEATAKEASIDLSTQNEILEVLHVLAAQAAQPKETRRMGVVRHL
ncbi:MAG: hypothetical protein OEW00_10705, partial [candidate division Zixibacteria bacterium]|nr:hypothetical protein [candidate division Zixibacteria bacterium]